MKFLVKFPVKFPDAALRTLTLAALLAGTGTAQAELTLHSSAASFQAAISAPQVDGFDDLFWAEGPQYIYRSVGGYEYYGYSLMPDANYSSFYNAGSDSDVWLSTNQATDILSFQLLNSAVYGVGGYFFATDANGAFLPGQSIKLDALDAEGHELVHIIDNASPTRFYGFSSSSPILYFEVSALQPAGDYAWVAANDLTLGGMAAAVPEPAGVGMMLAGLGLVGWAARRRSDR